MGANHKAEKIIFNRKTKILFSQAYILGGSPCSGKSTIAERLSSELRLPYYKVDDHEREHLNRCHPDRHPTMCKYAKMGWNEIWMRPVHYQVQEEFEYYRERFEIIIKDIEKYGPGTPIILEGAAYLPELLDLCDVNPKRVIFLVPTKEFQLHHYRQRRWVKQILRECEDPKRAFDNWMLRDHLFGKEIIKQAKEKKFETLLVDGALSIDQQYDKTKRYFDLK